MVSARRHVGSSLEAPQRLPPARSSAQRRGAAAVGDHRDFEAVEALQLQLGAADAPLAPAQQAPETQLQLLITH